MHDAQTFLLEVQLKNYNQSKKAISRKQ